MNVSFKEDQARFVIESMIKRLDKKKNPNLLQIQMADEVIRKMGKSFNKNKHSGGFINTILNEITRIATRWGVEKIGQRWKNHLRDKRKK